MRKKIIAADDERALRLLVSGTLEICDYLVIEAENGLQALELARQEKPDLIILDVMMPGMSGLEVCKHIKTDPDLQGTKVLILTAKGQQSDKEAAKEVMADCYLSKPFSPAILLAMVEEVLG